jgi:ribosome-associated toxin RatA of RatAB toxin-antitoxin module
MKKFLICIALLPTCVSALSAADGPDPETLGMLLAGEIVAFDTKSDESGASARMQLLVQAPPQAIWNVIISCELAFVFVDGLTHCEVLEEAGDRALVHQVVKRGWPIPTQDFTFESLRQPYSEIEFRLVEGNLKAMEGYWRFTVRPEGTLVDYQVRIQPEIPAPRFIVRRNIRKGMPDLLACVRGLAGGSGEDSRAEADLDRCPGSTEDLPGQGG